MVDRMGLGSYSDPVVNFHPRHNKLLHLQTDPETNLLQKVCVFKVVMWQGEYM